MLYAFVGGPFDKQVMPVNMIDTPRGEVAPPIVRLEAIDTKFGKIPRFVEEGGEVYRLVDGEYVWEGDGE